MILYLIDINIALQRRKDALILASEAKSARLLVIYSRLASGDVLNKRELSQRFGTSERSVQRDMESLRCFFADQNLPQDIVYDRSHQGYRLVQKEEAVFTNSEILAVCKILLESRSMVQEEMFPLLDKLLDRCVPEQNKRMVKSLIANEKFLYVPPHHGTKSPYPASGNSDKPFKAIPSLRSNTKSSRGKRLSIALLNRLAYCSLNTIFIC